ncbi:unnamed protein product [Candidula unifasciata]|uniref:V-SNARE coiled-coil homology domain-containing protein n=1 Tax=Candidula unifasciata TaxID=100452 RepID=A0A8S3ZJK0_9EUPU|nr:unnamed protein product [Candidula unifasciata]
MTSWAGTSVNHLDELENEVTEVTALLRQNVEKLLERGEKIDRLQSRSENLESSSTNFKLSAAKTRKKMWWRNFRMSCLLGWMIFLIIAITVTIILGKHGETLTDTPHSV